jgi:glutathione S-transferase
MPGTSMADFSFRPRGESTEVRWTMSGHNNFIARAIEEARALLQTALDIVERDIVGKRWSAGDIFNMTDCSAAPALFYADKVTSFTRSHRQAADYLTRLKERASFARVLREAEPYFKYLPEG